MLELSVLDIFLLVATFFLIILGTLLFLVLLRVLKILRVATEIADFYFSFKQTLGGYIEASQHFKDTFFSTLEEKEIKSHEKKDSL